MNEQFKIDTPVGAIYLVASEKGLSEVRSRRGKAPLVTKLTSAAGKHLKQGARELNEYFAGKRKDFEVALDMQGTDFQKKVWAQLLKVPYGSTTDYQSIADRLQKPKATRAVGTANGRNPLWIIVPCHRIIGRDGKLRGYAGGLPMKAHLLELEQPNLFTFADTDRWRLGTP